MWWDPEGWGPEGWSQKAEGWGSEEWSNRAPEGWGPEGWGPKGWGPEGWGSGWGPQLWGGPKFCDFFSLPHPFSFLFSLLEVFSWNFGGASEGWDTLMCAFGVLRGLSCEALPPLPKIQIVNNMMSIVAFIIIILVVF